MEERRERMTQRTMWRDVGVRVWISHRMKMRREIKLNFKQAYRQHYRERGRGGEEGGRERDREIGKEGDRENRIRSTTLKKNQRDQTRQDISFFTANCFE